MQNIQRPVNGWVRSIRNALGMTGKQLARRLGVSAERIVKIEADELDKKLTMATLEKVAQAMNCDFIYGFVPKDKGFKGIIEQQAQLRAREQLKEVMHTMILEDQKTSKAAVKTQLSILVKQPIGV